MSYADLLRDPRWQRKRLEVMQRADFACERCGDKATTLNVHHVEYVRGRMPWEYPDNELACLCQPCHGREHGIEDVIAKRRATAAAEERARRDARRAKALQNLADADRHICERLLAIDARLAHALPDEQDELLREKNDLCYEIRHMDRARQRIIEAARR